jgi:hypothetical protein
MDGREGALPSACHGLGRRVLWGARASSTFCHLGTFSNLANVGQSKRLILPDREKQYERGDGVAMHMSLVAIRGPLPGAASAGWPPRRRCRRARGCSSAPRGPVPSAAPAASPAPGWWPRSVNGRPLSNRLRAPVRLPATRGLHRVDRAPHVGWQLDARARRHGRRRVALRTGWQALALARLGRPPRRRSRRWSSSRPAASISRVPSPRCRSSRSGPAGTSSAPCARTA